MESAPSELELEIRTQLAEAQLERVAVLTLQRYGDELLGYLLGLLGDSEQAREVFSSFAEDLWRGLPQLTLRSTMRAYCYALARNAAHRYLDRDLRRQRRAQPLSTDHPIAHALAQPRTPTAPFARTENQQRVAALRERLSPEERELLTLRIDRGLSWHEVAHALGHADADADAELAAAVTRLRKRFQLTKQKLVRWAREEGIVPPTREE